MSGARLPKRTIGTATAVVTGANRGLGLEVARQLSARGSDVLAGARGNVLPAAAGRGGHGRLVNVSSGGGALTGMRDGAPACSISKAALNALTLMLADALPGVLVNAVCPGWIATDMSGPGGRPVAEGAPGTVWAATLPDSAPTGGFFGDGRPIARWPERDPRHDRRSAEQLGRADGVVEDERAGRSADQRLEVDERAGHLGRHTCLRPREQPEGQRRPGQSQRGDGDDRRGRRGRGRHALEEHGERERSAAAGRELDGGDGAGVAIPQQRRPGDDEAGRARDRSEHQQVAGQRGAGRAAAGHEADAGQRQQRAAPGRPGGRPAAERRGDQRDEDRHSPDAILKVVARDVAELQRVLIRLSTRGGTLLRLKELKPSSPLPLEPTR